jgi:hypothetical protein
MKTSVDLNYIADLYVLDMLASEKLVEIGTDAL